jgi:hypothetical protein
MIIFLLNRLIFCVENQERQENQKLNFYRRLQMSNAEAMKIIEDVGLKKGSVAISCGLHPVKFSQFLSGTRELRPEQHERVTEYLTRMKFA